MKHLFASLAGILSLLLVLHTNITLAQTTNTWTGTTSTDWNTPTNWSQGHVPLATDDVLIVATPNQPVIGASTSAVGYTIELQFTASLGSTPSLSIVNGGSLTLNGSKSTEGSSGAFLSRGTVTNSGQIVIGNIATATVEGSGIVNNNQFTNTTEGSITINRTTQSGLHSRSNRFFNSGTIVIGSVAAVGSYGIVNDATFFNNPGGSIAIDRTSSAGVRNFNRFTNSSTIIVGAVAAVGPNAIFNFNTFNNTGCNALINIVADAVVFNNIASSGTFDNTGTIIENASGDSNISSNTGLVQNLNGGSFTVSTGNAATTSTGLIWTGCASPDWNTATNWSLGHVPLATDDVIIPAGTANAPVVSTTAIAQTVEVQTGASLTLTSTASLSINDRKTVTGNNFAATTSFFNGGTMYNQGALVVNGGAQFGIWNTDTFSNVSGGSVTIDRASNTGIFNESGSFVNSSTVCIGSVISVGSAGMVNRSSFSNVSGGFIRIDQSGSGVLNQASFVNSATILMGTSVINNAISNQSGGTVDNQGCQALWQSLGNGIIANAGSFSNTGTIIENSTDNSSISYNGGLVQNLNGGNFTITDTNIGVVTTIPGSLPVITAIPSLTITQGQSTTFSASGALNYNWSSGPINTSAISVSVAGPYSVTGSIGNCSNTTTVTVVVTVAPPAITTQPVPASTVCEGASVVVTVGVSGSISGYQWLKGGSPIPGQTTATLSLTNAQIGDAGVYSLSLTGPTGNTTSSGFTLSVNPTPTATITFPNSVTVQGTGIPVVQVPPLTNPVIFQASGGSVYERVIIVDRLNGYEIRQSDSNTTGIFPITRLGLFTLTVTGTGGCSRTVQWVVQVQ